MAESLNRSLWSKALTGAACVMMLLETVRATNAMVHNSEFGGVSFVGAGLPATLVAIGGPFAATIGFWGAALCWKERRVGFIMVLAFSVVRENTPPWAAGTAIGVTNGFVVGSGAVLQPLLGWLLDLSWDGTLIDGVRSYTPENYETAFLVLPAFGLLGLLCALAVRETHGQPCVESE